MTQSRSARPSEPVRAGPIALAPWIRAAFAGPGAVIVSLVVTAGMTQWLPSGTAGIDNLVLPLVLLPIIWAGLFFHACLDRKLARVAIVAIGLLAVHGGLVAREFMAAHAPAPKVAR